MKIDGAPLTVTQVPDLPDRFTETFASRFVTANGVTFHVVAGGRGPAVLLLPGWPQFWYAWRLIMPALARGRTVVAADPRGLGASDKPEDGYDSETLAGDMTGLMSALGHERFGVVGYDLGMMISYAMAADHPDRVTRLAVAEGILPGLSPSSPLVLPGPQNEFLWHIPFNRVRNLNEQLVAGREDVYFGYQFSTKAASPTAIPARAVDVYVEALKDPAALRASFEYYRDERTEEQNKRRSTSTLQTPVLAIGGERSIGSGVEETMRRVADDVTGVVIPGSGHFVAEEAPADVSGALLRFFQRRP